MDNLPQPHGEYHPLSKWQEPWSDPRLTLFDLHRTPRPILHNKHLQLPLEKLNFTCPICLGYIRKTAVIMECLHRYCDQCIQKCLRVGKKECPSCRIHIPSRRSLRADPKFDLLIQHICGDLDALEQKETEEIERYKDLHKESSRNRKRGMLEQASQRKALRTTMGTSTGTTARPSGRPVLMQRIQPLHSVVAARNQEQLHSTQENPIMLEPLVIEASPLIEFELRKYPSETRVDRLAREHLRVNGQATIGLLKGFLSKKLSHPNRQEFIITITIQEGVFALDDSITLEEAKKDISEDVLMILHYRLGNMK